MHLFFVGKKPLVTQAFGLILPPLTLPWIKKHSYLAHLGSEPGRYAITRASTGRGDFLSRCFCLEALDGH